MVTLAARGHGAHARLYRHLGVGQERVQAGVAELALPALVLVGAVWLGMSAASAIYLILELGQPFEGLMQVPSAPLRSALPPL